MTQQRKRLRNQGRKTKYPGVKKLGPGKYLVRLNPRHPKSGKKVPIERTVHAPTAEDAFVIRNQWRAKILNPPEQSQEMTLSVCAKLWMKACAKSGDSRSTRENKADVLTLHLLPVKPEGNGPILGDFVVQRLDRYDFISWMEQASARMKPNGGHYAWDTAIGWGRVVTSFMAWATIKLRLPVNPVSNLDFTKYIHRECPKDVQAGKGSNALMANELNIFLQVAEQMYPQHFAMMVVGFFTGMRWSELSVLEWDDFAHETMEIKIVKSQWRGTKRALTKSKKVRGPAFDVFMWEVLQEHRQRMMREQTPGFDSGLCFPSEKGGYRYASLLKNPFKQICEEAGIRKRLSTKVFRRTFNDLARQAKVKDLVRRAMIGHADDGVAEDYTTIHPSEKQEALGDVRVLVGWKKDK